LFRRIRGLVDEVVTRYPPITAISLGEDFPQMYDTILKVFVLPKQGHLCRVVGMPVLVLESGQSMQVDDRVDAVNGADIDDAIEISQTRFANRHRRHVVFKMAVVHGEPYKVQAKGTNKRGIAGAEETLKEAIEESLVTLRSEHRMKRLTHSFFVRGIAHDEVFHVHPPAQSEAAQHDRFAGLIDQAAAANA
jgi:hypothetical protein